MNKPANTRHRRMGLPVRLVVSVAIGTALVPSSGMVTGLGVGAATFIALTIFARR